jgi:hypothetical protein
MQSRILLAAVLLVAGCAPARSRPTPPPPHAGATIDVFEASLAMHGEWIVAGSFGRVWRPVHVGAGWQPYLYGEWVWTDEGWFWLTDEPWGWATYHYGRWAFDPRLGWIWVPGFVWGPAWVAWRVGDGFVGWAPLYPHVVDWWADSYPLEPPHWIFVPTSSFVGVRVDIVAVPRARIPGLIRASRPAPPPSSVRPSPAPRLGGPPRQLVEAQVGRPVRPARIVAVPAPADARRRPEPGAVPVYRPTPGEGRPTPSGRPAPSRAAPAPTTPAPPTPAPTPPTPAPTPPAPAPAVPAPRPEVAPEHGDAPERARAAPPATKPRAAPQRGKTPQNPPAGEKEGERPSPARPPR